MQQFIVVKCKHNNSDLRSLLTAVVMAMVFVIMCDLRKFESCDFGFDCLLQIFLISVAHGQLLAFVKAIFVMSLEPLIVLCRSDQFLDRVVTSRHCCQVPVCMVNVGLFDQVPDAQVVEQSYKDCDASVQRELAILGVHLILAHSA